MVDEPLWLTIPEPRPDARLRLLCLPYAGGGAGLYRSWAHRAPDWLEVAAALLPGREARLAQPAHSATSTLVPELLRALEPVLRERPYAVFGHSMGALIGFELCRAVRRAGLPEPRALLVSARRAPDLPRPADRPLAHTLPPQDFLQVLREYGGTPDELLAQPELLELFLPTLRADFALVDTYAYRPEPPLDLPLAGYAGTLDQEAPPHQVAQWQRHTTGSFRRRELDGGHFFLLERQDEFRQLLLSDLQQMTAGDNQRITPAS